MLAFDRRIARRRRCGALIPAAAACACMGGGCISGSLASDSGPSVGDWCARDTQQVHVGEKVKFSFVLARSGEPLDPFGIADYCIGEIGNRRVNAELTATGHYRFELPIEGFAAGQSVTARAIAYRRHGLRDAMFINGEWVRSDNPYDPADLPVADDEIELVVYGSLVDLRFEHPGRDLLMSTGRLELGSSDGSRATVNQARPGLPGFVADGPVDGMYHVTYEPTADQLNKKGITPVRFTVYDEGNQKHIIDAVVQTP